MTKSEKVLISTAIFIVATFGASAQTSVFEINGQIRETKDSIQKIRETNKREIKCALRRNSAYAYVMEYAEQTDSLRMQNARLLDEAVAVVRRRFPTALVTRNAMLFFQYSKIPRVQSIGALYQMNEDRIRKYEKKRESVAGFEQTVKNRCDSIMHAQIEMYQHRLDSLLDVKNNIINSHGR